MEQCEFPAPGTDRLQLSSPGASLPVARGVPICASSPSSMPAEDKSFGEAGEDCGGRRVGFGSFINFLQKAKDQKASFVAMSSAWPRKHQDCRDVMQHYQALAEYFPPIA